MGRSILGLFVFLGVIFGFEYYCYAGLSAMFEGSPIVDWIYSGTVFLFFAGFVMAAGQFRSTTRTLWTNLFIGFSFSVFVSKLFLAVGFLIQDLIRLLVGLGGFILNNAENLVPGRSDIGNLLVLIFGAIPFFSMLYGITKGKYRYKVNRVRVKIDKLPTAFEGFKVAQISDIHSGTFDSVKQVEKGVQLINDEKPDLFVFTGDLINFHKDEIDPYIDTFAKIKAPYGRYSILGNHDYYGIQNVPKERQHKYFDDFAQKHEAIGFDLLRNKNVQIRKEGECINLIGVENWGTGGFPKTGDLDKAILGKTENSPNILLSHDPSHWDHVVIRHKEKMDLTLSGHTHGMQFGIQVGKFKWSPVQYRYKRWMGLYTEKNRQLYVNRGFGFLGFPGRVFMWPEITIFELTAS